MAETWNNQATAAIAILTGVVIGAIPGLRVSAGSLAVAVDDCDACASLGKSAAARGADAVAAAGDERDLPGQIDCHSVLLAIAVAKARLG